MLCSAFLDTIADREQKGSQIVHGQQSLEEQMNDKKKLEQKISEIRQQIADEEEESHTLGENYDNIHPYKIASNAKLCNSSPTGSVDEPLLAQNVD